MANDVYRTVTGCQECVQNNPSEERRRPIQLFPTGGPLEFIAMEILGPFQKTLNGNQPVLVMNDRSIKLSRAEPTSEKIALHIASLFKEK